MSMFRTPQGNRTMKGEPVFKTPMSYSPHVTGDQARPSPSRFEIWKEQLGLDDTAVAMDESPFSSDDEDDKENQRKTCSLIEYQALQKELDERNTQRDELLLKLKTVWKELDQRNAQRDKLLFKLKTLSENNKHYKSRLDKEETNKKQQLKILKKTHEVSLREKENLIRNLESICEEQETRITELEQTLKGVKHIDKELQTRGLHRLVNQIEELQEKNTELNHTVLTSQAQVEQLTSELCELRGSCEQTDSEKTQLQDEIIKLRTTKGNGNTDDQKLVHKMEVENERLKKDLDKLQKEVCGLNAQLADQQVLEAEKLVTKQLKEENEQLKSRIGEVENELKHRPTESEDSKEQAKKLGDENHQLSQEVRSLNAKLMALQARSPEIVTKVKTVEIESEGLKSDYTKLQQQLTQVQQENAALQSEINKLKQEAQQNSSLVAASQAQVTIVEKEKASLKSQLESEISKIKQSYEECSQEHTKATNTISELQNQLQSQTEANQQLSQENCNLNESLQQRLNEIQQYKNQIEEMKQQTAEDISDLKQAHQEQVESLGKEHEQNVIDIQRKLNYMTAQMSVIGPEFAELKKNYVKLRKECEGMPQFIQATVKETTKQICKAIQEISQYNLQLVDKYRKEMKLRKKFHNQLVELKGNIRVFARVRPQIKEDGSGAMAQNIVAYDQEDDAVINVLNKGRVQTFELDRVFSADISQEQVFSEVEALVISCLDGYNVCIFAYGQTGSGKTYTMEGPPHNPGINQRALQQLFTETSERSTGTQFTISVSVMEIYNEIIRDLLSPDPSCKLEVKMSSEGGLHVPGLKSVQVSSVEDVNQVFSTGHKNRATASTNMNEHSSRSHALLQIKVESKNMTTGTKTFGKLNLVDLAGSERVSKSGADGARLKEAQNINKSLSCLGDVMHALRSKQPHVPYRNSKLTYLLQDSLGGDSKTLMIVQVAPVEKNVGESLASLSFAQRVRAIELGQATKKTESSEVADLKERLAQYEDIAQFSNGYSKGNKPTPSKIARRK